jgi:hypothetical protein
MRTWRAVPFDPDQDALRRRPRLSPATPRPSSASVLGSGTPLPPNFIVKLRIVGSAKRKADRKTALSFRLVSFLRSLRCRQLRAQLISMGKQTAIAGFVASHRASKRILSVICSAFSMAPPPAVLSKMHHVCEPRGTAHRPRAQRSIWSGV